MLTQEKKGISKITENFNEAGKDYGMKINIKKILYKEVIQKNNFKKTLIKRLVKCLVWSVVFCGHYGKNMR